MIANNYKKTLFYSYNKFLTTNLNRLLSNKFNLEINSYGLLDAINNWTPILKYMNDEEIGLEPVPWYSAKIKLVNP